MNPWTVAIMFTVGFLICVMLVEIFLEWWDGRK